MAVEGENTFAADTEKAQEDNKVIRGRTFGLVHTNPMKDRTDTKQAEIRN